MTSNPNGPCRLIDLGLVSYGEALALQRRTVDELKDTGKGESFFLLEHEPVITMGKNADGSSLIASRRLLEREGIELVHTDRGGDVTYHGPGQLVGYPIILLEPDRRDIARYVRDLEEVIIKTLAAFGVEGYHHPEHRGVWTGDKKIASIGVRISKWVTSHGFALNVSTDLTRFSLIHPCGIVGCTMTSMEVELEEKPDMAEVKRLIAENFAEVFGRELTVATGAGTGQGKAMRS